MFTKIGAFLGTLSFIAMMALGIHINAESHSYTAPPTLEQQLSNTVSITTAKGIYCSGWVLKDAHVVVTAAHCNEDPTEMMLVDFGDGVNHNFHVQKKGDSEFNTGPDLMTLTTNDDTVHWPVGMSVCKFKPYYGEELNLIGGPLAYEKSITFGTVSNPKRDFSTHSAAGPFINDLIQYDGTLLPGNSGGPAIDSATGCVMGSGELVIVATPEAGVPYGLNFLTPVSDLSLLK